MDETRSIGCDVPAMSNKPSEVTQRIQRIEQIRNTVRGIRDMADGVGNNVLGVEPTGPNTDSDKELTVSNNGTLHELDRQLDKLSRCVDECALVVQRLEHL